MTAPTAPAAPTHYVITAEDLELLLAYSDRGDGPLTVDATPVTGLDVQFDFDSVDFVRTDSDPDVWASEETCKWLGVDD